jgi:hypothetical protein
MKLFLILSSILTFIILTSSQCKKNKQVDIFDQLPAETQIGANTFGCLVNGKVFKPKGSSLAGPILQANYQLIYSPPTGYILGITGRDRSTEEIKSISIGFDSLIAEQGKKYQLTTIIKGNAGGQYGLYPSTGSYQIFQSNDTATGELWIKKFDPVNQIVSGTFWFDAVNGSGQKVEVRDGRFDVRYTQ